jgi:HAD superfamily hydrolase (TIGR01459 family)
LSTQKTWPNTNAVTELISNIQSIASRYDAIVFDQWGVLHNGTSAYVGAIEAIEQLGKLAPKLGVLSNSGKRADANAHRIAGMGFDVAQFDTVMTSGEALWRDMANGVIAQKRFFPIEGRVGDAENWAAGLNIEITRDVRKADAILVMGLREDVALKDFVSRLKCWLTRKLPVYCSNPDRQSPRADGSVVSPGALAFAYGDLGGTVTFYGKPHNPIFKSIEAVMGPGRYLMVGDSLEHDIAGANSAGWDSLLIQGGLYAGAFEADDSDSTLARLVTAQNCQPPTYRIKELR